MLAGWRRLRGCATGGPFPIAPVPAAPEGGESGGGEIGRTYDAL
ncbi:unnamed protein product [Strongylus vulgaris]|uniref:Uncharacterized protein n=1 Tax=Strongylus vulgaris TaxID=40348 RepID=A0A3P7M3W4_STRVU|nr:unnamed protein product [Strongylus vulgaris]